MRIVKLAAAAALAAVLSASTAHAADTVKIALVVKALGIPVLDRKSVV